MLLWWWVCIFEHIWSTIRDGILAKDLNVKSHFDRCVRFSILAIPNLHRRASCRDSNTSERFVHWLRYSTTSICSPLRRQAVSIKRPSVGITTQLEIALKVICNRNMVLDMNLALRWLKLANSYHCSHSPCLPDHRPFEGLVHQAHQQLIEPAHHQVHQDINSHRCPHRLNSSIRSLHQRKRKKKSRSSAHQPKSICHQLPCRDNKTYPHHHRQSENYQSRLDLSHRARQLGHYPWVMILQDYHLLCYSRWKNPSLY